jgi:hypothetical protein
MIKKQILEVEVPKEIVITAGIPQKYQWAKVQKDIGVCQVWYWGKMVKQLLCSKVVLNQSQSGNKSPKRKGFQKIWWNRYEKWKNSEKWIKDGEKAACKFVMEINT